MPICCAPLLAPAHTAGAGSPRRPPEEHAPVGLCSNTQWLLWQAASLGLYGGARGWVRGPVLSSDTRWSWPRCIDDLGACRLDPRVRSWWTGALGAAAAHYVSLPFHFHYQEGKTSCLRLRFFRFAGKQIDRLTVALHFFGASLWSCNSEEMSAREGTLVWPFCFMGVLVDTPRGLRAFAGQRAAAAPCGGCALVFSWPTTRFC